MPPIYSAVNLLATATISSLVASLAFPPSRIADGRVGRPAALATSIGYWQADLGSAKAVSFVSVHGHNLPADAGLQVEWSTTGAGWIPIPLDITAGTGETWATFAPIVARYWRLNVTASGTSPPGLPRVGEWWLGSRVVMSKSWAFGAVEGRDVAGVVVRSEYGVPNGYHLADYRAFEGDLPPMDDALAAEAAALLRASRFGAHAIAFVPDSAKPGQVIVGRVREGGYRHSRFAPGLWSGGEISVIEDSWARPA